MIKEKKNNPGGLNTPEAYDYGKVFEVKIRQDLLDHKSPKGTEIFQLTSGDVPYSHIYMEAQIFTPDSKRFILHRSAHPHGSDKNDPRHQYLVCDTEAGCSLHPITEETGATAPSVSPDGTLLYYFVNETEINGGTLTLKSVRLDGSERQTVMVIDSPLHGTPHRPSLIYPLSTIRSDGKSIALSCFLGDGRSENQLWGLMIFDLEKISVSLILKGQNWCNIHPQYCRSTDIAEMRDMLVQENHGNFSDASGKVIKGVGGVGADIHLIRDDGTNFRNMPWGRDGNELCQGHQSWRGRTAWAITSTINRIPDEQQLIESKAVEYSGHIGALSPGGIRNRLSRSFATPCFFHFATDIAGKLLVTDTGDKKSLSGGLYIAKTGEPGIDPLSDWTCLCQPRASQVHMHPFLSPDGTMAFFNSDESGILHTYMARGF